MATVTNVRPVGIWRFLTPLETIQVGDLGRASDFETTDSMDTNWSPVRKGSVWSIDGSMEKVVGKQVPHGNSWEFIRAVDGFFVKVEAKNDH